MSISTQPKIDLANDPDYSFCNDPAHANDPEYTAIDINKIEELWRKTFDIPERVTAEPEVMVEMVYMVLWKEMKLPLCKPDNQEQLWLDGDDTIIKIGHNASPYGFVFISARYYAARIGNDLD
jgi:hypothetical protein